MRAKDAERAAHSGETLGARFPAVSRLSIKLIYLNAQGHVLEEKALALTPADPCRFTVGCPGRCGIGSFDFSAKLEQALGERLASFDCSGKCEQPLYAGSKEVCGCELKCRIEAAFLPPVETPSTPPVV